MSRKKILKLMIISVISILVLLPMAYAISMTCNMIGCQGWYSCYSGGGDIVEE